MVQPTQEPAPLLEFLLPNHLLSVVYVPLYLVESCELLSSTSQLPLPPPSLLS